MEQGGVVLARRARPHQPGVLAQQLLKFGLITADDGFGRRFEVRRGGAALRERSEVRRKIRPVPEAVRARQHKLRVGEHATAALAVERSLGEFFHLLRRAIDVPPTRAGEQRRHPAIAPGSYVAVARLAGIDELLGELLVLLDAGTGGKRSWARRNGN